jgi:hypothetical protein
MHLSVANPTRFPSPVDSEKICMKHLLFYVGGKQAAPHQANLRGYYGIFTLTYLWACDFIYHVNVYGIVKELRENRTA